MSLFFTIAVVLLIFLIIFQIAKAAEYVAVLKGEQKSNKQQNKINAFLMISFLVLGLIGVYCCNELFYGKTLGALYFVCQRFFMERVKPVCKIRFVIPACRDFAIAKPAFLFLSAWLAARGAIPRHLLNRHFYTGSGLDYTA